MSDEKRCQVCGLFDCARECPVALGTAVTHRRHVAELADLRAELAEAKAENERLKAELETANKHVEIVTVAREEYGTHIATLEAALAAKNAELATYKNGHSVELERAKGRLSAALARIAELEAERKAVAEVVAEWRTGRRDATTAMLILAGDAPHPPPPVQSDKTGGDLFSPCPEPGCCLSADHAGAHLVMPRTTTYGDRRCLACGVHHGEGLPCPKMDENIPSAHLPRQRL